MPSIQRAIAAAVLSGALVVLAFPGYGYEVGLDWVVWFALAPLFWAAAGGGGGRGFLLGWATGVVLEGAGFIWILLAIRRFTGVPSPVAALLFFGWLCFESLPWGLLGWWVGRWRRPAQIAWVIPFWVGLEHYYPRLFPWHLGGALYGREWLVQNADLLGTSGLSALVVLANVTACRLLVLRRGGKFPVASLIVLAALAGGALVYGRFRLSEMEAIDAGAPRIRVALVQGALDPLKRRNQALPFYLGKTREVLESVVSSPPDLVVWPEGADPLLFNLEKGKDPWLTHREDDNSPPVRLDREVRVPLLVGGSGLDPGRPIPGSNIAAYIRPGARPSFYEKNHRMMFGEYIPLVPSSWLRRLDIPAETIAAGTGNPILELNGTSFRCLICYEATLPGYVRRNAGGVDFFANVTEDMWYGRTAHIPQHVSVLILRVVETRTPLLRATNIGPSGVFDITGRFRSGRAIFAPEVVQTELKARSAPSLYKRGGHLFALAMILVAAARLALSLRGRQ